MSRLDEIRAVKSLGEKIGYGNMMDIASALWSMDLTNTFGGERFGHVPTVLPNVKSEEVLGVKHGIRIRIDEIRYELGLETKKEKPQIGANH